MTSPVHTDTTSADIARVVAEYWRDYAMSAETTHLTQTFLWSHPFETILSALDGETDPTVLSLSDGTHADTIRALTNAMRA